MLCDFAHFNDPRFREIYLEGKHFTVLPYHYGVSTTFPIPERASTIS